MEVILCSAPLLILLFYVLYFNALADEERGERIRRERFKEWQRKRR